jgi:site-specific recombinase XerD
MRWQMQRMVFKPYPKGREFGTLRISPDLTERLAARAQRMNLSRDDLFFPSTIDRGPVPLSRNTFRTRYWRPALNRADITYGVRMHDLRYAHASWLLAGGADLKTVMQRLGHAQIQTTQKYLHTARRRRPGAGRIHEDPQPRAAHVIGSLGQTLGVW